MFHINESAERGENIFVTADTIAGLAEAYIRARFNSGLNLGTPGFYDCGRGLTNNEYIELCKTLDSISYDLIVKLKEERRLAQEEKERREVERQKEESFATLMKTVEEIGPYLGPKYMAKLDAAIKKYWADTECGKFTTESTDGVDMV